MNNLATARTYKNALFAEAQRQNQLFACLQGLEQMNRSVQSQPGLHEVFMHPMIDLSQKQKLADSVLGECCTPLLSKFFLLMIQRHRLNLLSLVSSDFRDAYDRAQKIEPVQVRSAFALSVTQAEALKQRLEKVFESGIRMQIVIDDSLIGGFVAQSKDFKLDRSLKGQLAELKKTTTF